MTPGRKPKFFSDQEGPQEYDQRRMAVPTQPTPPEMVQYFADFAQQSNVEHATSPESSFRFSSLSESVPPHEVPPRNELYKEDLMGDDEAAAMLCAPDLKHLSEEYYVKEEPPSLDETAEASNSTNFTSEPEMKLDLFEELYSNDLDCPIYLQNILKFSGFDKKQCFLNFDDNAILDIETFAKTTLPSLISENEDMENFYGVFKNYPAKFMIVPGHRKLLYSIANYCQLTLRRNEESRLQNLKRKSDFENRWLKTQRASNSSTNHEFIPETNGVKRDPALGEEAQEEEIQILINLINTWIDKFLESLAEADYPVEINKIKLNRANLSVKIKVERGVYYGYVRCYICNHTMKTSKRKINDSGPNWMLSNFYKHFKHHFSPKNGQKRLSQNLYGMHAN